MTRNMAGKWTLVAIWMLSLIVVAIAMSAFSFAQTRFQNAPIMSGSDIGFRIEGKKDGAPVGTLMVRVNGQWVEAGWNPRAMPAK